MTSISILSSLKRKLLRRDREEPEERSVGRGILSTLPATLPVALGAFRARSFRALTQGHVKRENNKVNQGVLLTNAYHPRYQIYGLMVSLPNQWVLKYY
jgi:predicted acyltransferase